MTRLAAVLLTLWAGSLWTVCAIAAPVAFAVLDDRHAAGRVAATLFEIETWLGAVAALLLFACAALHKPLALRLAPTWLVAATAAAPLISELVLSPMMASARAANDMSRFGLLHGISALLFVAAALGALLLVLRFNRPAG
ncbi:MAG TPA: DUF4149 domain-containing protein [Steroidobacteraceae bacterium]|nr:DUF4149 domain-containing protein [Steroidobacteraceae bacterium]